MVKKLTRAFELLGALTLLWIWGFSSYLENSRPTHPIGRFNVQMPVHGDYVYISQVENVLRVFSWPLFFILVILSVALEIAGRSEG
jgi:hypothetical protein